jgi:hypothetical protein
MLRWAAELASDVRVEARAAVGVVALQGLTRSELLQPEDRALIEGIYEELVGPALDGYSEGDLVQEEDASRREG